jgi:hypothetical protein
MLGHVPNYGNLINLSVPKWCAFLVVTEVNMDITNEMILQAKELSCEFKEAFKNKNSISVLKRKMHVGICTANLLLKELEKLNKKE